MKAHILAALTEERDRWEELLAGLDEAQITTPLVPSHWSIKDVIAHVRAWQQRSIARVDAARLGCEPAFPRWPSDLDPDAEGNTERLNAWLYESSRDMNWLTVHRNWREGFDRLLELAEAISERDLLDSSRYPWLKGYSLAFILIASYDHHQEHLEKTQAWLSDKS